MIEKLNCQLDQPVMIDLSQHPWDPSPSPNVVRKRLYLEGERESGRVTSIVRYLPGSKFPAHPHPDGEEIFVLQGVFSDQGGNWPAGTLLLNPQGFEHAPSSHLGCLLLVHLKQYPGKNREQYRLDSTSIPWQRGEQCMEKSLYKNDDDSLEWILQQWVTGQKLPVFDRMTEILVVSGCLRTDIAMYPDLSWLRFPPGYQHGLTCLDDSQVVIRLCQ